MKLFLGRAPISEYTTPAMQEKMANVANCLHCNQCASRCPYGLDTPKLLEENLAFFQEFMAHRKTQ